MRILQCFRFGPIAQSRVIRRCTGSRAMGTPAGIFRSGSDHGDDDFAYSTRMSSFEDLRRYATVGNWSRQSAMRISPRLGAVEMPGRTSFPENASVTRPNSYPVRDPASCRSP